MSPMLEKVEGNAKLTTCSAIAQMMTSEVATNIPLSGEFNEGQSVRIYEAERGSNLKFSSRENMKHHGLLQFANSHVRSRLRNGRDSNKLLRGLPILHSQLRHWHSLLHFHPYSPHFQHSPLVSAHFQSFSSSASYLRPSLSLRRRRQ
jgi:hypothetical protein